MSRFPAFMLALGVFISCSKNDTGPVGPVVIPDSIDGVVVEFKLIQIDVNTLDKGTFFVTADNTKYRADFTASAEAESNAILKFQNDTILTDQSREFANLGSGAIAYNPVSANQISVFFHDGRKISGSFNQSTSFGGVFGEALISQWRDPGDPAKPTQKAKDDLINMVQRFDDKDGTGPDTTPQYLFIKISKG